MPHNKLSENDIDALMTNPSVENKISIIEKIAEGYNSDEFTALQHDRAEKIFRKLINDTEAEVRKTISNQLVSNSDVPVDIVLSLAKDIEEVACPMLEFSEVISDQDLLEIINESSSEARTVAIANRSTVSEDVSDALIDTNNESTVSSLFDNTGAKIRDESYDKALEEFSDSERVIDSLATRNSITEKVVNKMVAAISKSMCKRLEGRYQSNIKDLHKLFDDSTGGVTMKLLGQQTIDTELLDLVDALEEKGEVAKALKSDGGHFTNLLKELGKGTHYPIIPTLAIGNLNLFCIIMHEITHLPYDNVKKLIVDQRGYAALLTKARLPRNMFECVHIAIEVIDRMHHNGDVSTTNPVRNDLNLYIQRINEATEGQTIGQLNNFIEIIEQNIEEESGGW